MKEFHVSDYDYEHKISIPLRTLMCVDLPRVDYDKGKKVKKKDLDFVREQNRLMAERRAKQAEKKDEKEGA